MRSNKIEILIATAIISCLVIPSLTVFGQEGHIREQQGDLFLSENPLSNVTIEMITDLPAHRSDGIPSTLPDSTFSVQFNITNYSDQEIRELEFCPSSNDYGIILNPLNLTKDTLEVNESWITPEYDIETTSASGTSSGALDLAIVLDQSGSMGDEIYALTNQLIDVIDEISTEVPNLRIGLVLFGGSSSNPYSDSSLVNDLTSDIESIVEVLSYTQATGGHEPWGDALWVTQNRLTWRDDAVKLIVLITDEPCDSGEIIGTYGSTLDYDGPELYDLFGSLASDGFIVCSFAASGADSLTLKQLKAVADYTEGTYIEFGNDGPQTGDIPQIIGELIVYYAVELNLKIIINLSHLNDLDIRESVDRVFVILVDDLPPEIDSGAYLSEDFISDEKFINILCEIKDVTGAAYVDIYYKPGGLSYWIIANATLVYNSSYILTIPYDHSYSTLLYQVYSVDWLGNEVLTDPLTVNIIDLENQEIIRPGKRKEYVLLPNQAIICKLLNDGSENSFGIIFSENLNEFDTLAADVNESTLLLDNDNEPFNFVEVEKGHLVKLSLISQNTNKIMVTNVIPSEIDFGYNAKLNLDTTDAYLYKIDNSFTDKKSRSFVADSQVVQTDILLFNASDWEHLGTGSSEVFLPEEVIYVLFYAVYHTGEVYVSFDYEDAYTPYEHYYSGAMPFNFWYFLIPLFGMAAIYTMKKRHG